MTIYLILFLCIFNLNIHQGAGWDCLTEFSVNFQSSTEISFKNLTYNYFELVVSFSEAVQVESSLYSISWLNNLEKLPYTNNSTDTITALEYINYDIRNEEKIVSFSVFNSMVGLMDYDDSERETVLDLKLYFTFEEVNGTCVLQIQHNLVDANTAVPTFVKNVYTSSLIETFPIGLTIPGLLVNAFDYDALSPNNQFQVTVDDECPLKSSNVSYTSFQGLPVDVTFMLKEKLNYDTMNDPFQLECTINLEDKGISPLRSSPAIITLTVEPYPDEKPVFSSDFYTGTLQDTSVNSVIPISPEVLAINKDVPPSEEIVYRILTVDDNPVGSYNYFAIDNTTGVVTVIKKIDETFQSWGSAKFIVVAYNEDNQFANALLTINMPLEESDELHFDTSIYNAEILIGSEDKLFTVHAESSSGYSVEYKFVQNNAPGLDFFEIGKTTGIISETALATPGFYTLVVSADDGKATALSTVNINIIDTFKDGSIIPESIVSLNVEENYEGPIYNVSVAGEFTYCILGSNPSNYKSYFEVSSTGVVSIIRGLDAEYIQSVLVKIGLYEGVSECTTNSEFYTFSLRNEVLLNLTVDDVDEYIPYFKTNLGLSQSMIYLYYPSNIQLQKCMPTLMLSQILEVVDNDVTPNHTYSLEYSGSPQLFEIDSESGEIYYLNNLPASEYLFAPLDIVVGDPLHTSHLTVWVEELNVDNIFTIKLENIKLDEIQERLNIISREANINLILVYWSLVEGYDTGSSEFWDVNAHVYAEDLYLTYILGIEILNSALLNSIHSYPYLVAQPFTDIAYFSEEYESESESYKTATIALGCVLGFVICVLVLNYVYQSYYRKKSKKYGNVSTLGQAYANENFSGESESNERVQSVETVFGNTNSSPKSHEDSFGKSNLSKTEGNNVEMLSSLDQPGPSHVGQIQLDNISNENSSSGIENTSGNNTDSIFPSTDHVDEPNKFETTTDSLSSSENLGGSKDAILYPSLRESKPPEEVVVPTTSLDQKTIIIQPQQSSSSSEAREIEDKPLSGDERSIKDKESDGK